MGCCAFIFWEFVCLLIAGIIGLFCHVAGVVVAVVGTAALTWRFFSSVAQPPRHHGN